MFSKCLVYELICINIMIYFYSIRGIKEVPIAQSALFPRLFCELPRCGSLFSLRYVNLQVK